MADSSPLRALNCPNCGAPLEFPQARSSVRCRFCDSIIERSDDAPTPDDEGHALNVSIVDGRVSVARTGNRTSGARRFTIKMQGGQPMVFESGAPADPALAKVDEMVQASRHSITVDTLPHISSGQRPRRSGSSTGGCLGAFIIAALAIGIPAIAILATIPNIGALFGRVLTGNFEEAISNATTVGTRIYVDRSGALIPAQGDAAPDIIMLTTQYPASGGDGEKRLVAVSGESPKLLWRSVPLDKDTYDAPILADQDLVFTVSGTRLLAIRRTDGSTAWEAPLEDKVSLNICDQCVRLLDGRVWAFSDDGTLQAFDARTGQAQWTLKSNEDSPRGLYVLAGRPAFMDRDENNRGILRVFDPAAGEERTAQPVCQVGDSSPGYADWTTPLYAVPDSTDFLIVLGFSDLCVQRWDAQTLTPKWSAPIPDESSYSDDSAVVVTTEALYLPFRDQVVAVDTAAGQVRTLVQDADYQIAPLFVHDDALVVLAQRTRGSTRYELWAMAAATGERRWRFDLGEDPPVESPFGSTSIIDEAKPAWTVHPAADGLKVIRFKRAEDDKSHAILLETLDWNSGVSSGRQEIRLGIETIILSAPDIFGWTGSTLWMAIEQQLLGFDTARGEIFYRWP